MAKLKKNLCKWKKKDFTDNFDDLKKIVQNPNYICSKCGRAASAKKYLCDPESFR